jgi:hypothetical protein
VIADEGAEQEPREPVAEGLLETRVGAWAGGVAVVEGGAVLEEEHRSALARSPVWCGCGHALLLSTEQGAPLHP